MILKVIMQIYYRYSEAFSGNVLRLCMIHEVTKLNRFFVIQTLYVFGDLEINVGTKLHLYIKIL